MVLSEIEQSIKNKVEAIGKPLKEWDVRIYRGVLTGCNDAFIVSTEKRDEILSNCKTEEEREKTREIFRPILRGRDIKRYGYDWANLWVIFIPWHFPLQFDESIIGASVKAENLFKEQYPAVYQHMLEYKDALSSRNKAETGIRYEWYAMQRWGAKYLDDFEKQKIVWIELSDESKFALCRRMIPLNTVFFMTGNHLNHILGLLNSKLIHWYFTVCLGTSSGVGTNRWLKYTIEQLPLICSENEELEQLVSARLASESDIQEIEFQIDSLICTMYGLTAEERDYLSKL